jgi:hypothetical protein
MDNVKVGDRVQVCEAIKPKDGEVIKIIPSKNSKPSDYWNESKYSKQEIEDWSSYAEIKWDDNTVSTLNTDDLDPQDTAMEREFRNAVIAHDEQIQNKLDEACRALNEAVELSDKFGVPFHSQISFLSQGYKPESINQIFGDLDTDLIVSITQVYNEYEGWQHSQMC